MSAEKTNVIGLGDHLPHLVLSLIDGGEIRLKDLHGKKLVLFCWSSW